MLYQPKKKGRERESRQTIVLRDEEFHPQAKKYINQSCTAGSSLREMWAVINAGLDLII